nr:MAG TPA: hypothetical protein [Caudoviricetes sp.]
MSRHPAPAIRAVAAPQRSKPDNNGQEVYIDTQRRKGLVGPDNKQKQEGGSAESRDHGTDNAPVF